MLLQHPFSITSLSLGQVVSVSLTLAFPGTLVGQGAWWTGGQALPFV